MEQIPIQNRELITNYFLFIFKTNINIKHLIFIFDGAKIVRTKGKKMKNLNTIQTQSWWHLLMRQAV